MTKGVLPGLMIGFVVAVVIAAISSLSAPLPGTLSDGAGTRPPVPEGAMFNVPRDDAPAQMPAIASPPDKADSPAAPRADRDSVPTAVQEAPAVRDVPVETAYDGLPEAAQPDAGLTEAPSPENPVLPSPLAQGPVPAAVDTAPDITTRPALPPRAEPGEEVTGFPGADLAQAADGPEDAPSGEAGGADAPPAGQDREAVTSAGDGAAVADTGPATGEESGTDAMVSEADAAETAAEDVSDDVAASATEGAGTSAVDAGRPAEPEAVDATDAPDQSVAETADETDLSAGADALVTAAPEATEERPEVQVSPASDAQSGAGPDVVPGSASDPEGAADPVVTERGTGPGEATPEDTPPSGAADEAEPQVAAAAPSMPGTPVRPLTEREAEAAPAEAPAEPPAEDLRPPFEKFASPPVSASDRPLLSIILIDDGSGSQSLPRNFPYPVSVAIPTTSPKAAEIMQTYRRRGIEVLALMDSPAEGDIDAALGGITEAVAVMETGSRSLQGGRAQSERLAEGLKEAGYGLVLYPEGLDTGLRLAQRQGVPAGTVFRDLDSEGQSADVVRRFLDNAAFKAGQEDSVILVGRMRPETISALLVWALADRASRVAMVPVTQALAAPAN
ncbi:divergent polysaccharide deacetylase family protein [Pseudooceanicola sp. C21-150M6]|uniref:divergent polysaccharide deacetylase family protein n=1 Tax=Pseudooceanicola sp. C21-150M6 TaxID=3434355 RepID=UPI003D7F983F